MSITSPRREFVRPRVRAALAASATALGALTLLTPAPANAAITNQILGGSAGATRIVAADGIVESGLTSSSSLQTQATGKASSNTLADVTVPGLVHVDALTTQVATTAITGGKKIDSTARAAGVDLLGGVITATAVETASRVAIRNGIATPTGATRFVDLVVAGQTVPVNVPKNFTLNVPGVAKVVLNESRGVQTSDATARQVSSGLRVTLLSAVGSHPAGTTVTLTPTNAAATLPSQVPLGAAVGGRGYATQVKANVLGLVKVYSGPTALASMPTGGTAGRNITNNTVGVHLKGLLDTGVVSSTVNGSRAPEASRSTVTSKVAGVDVLEGLIKADAVIGRAQASKADGKAVVLSPRASFVNLVIGGRAIPVTVAPNTVINVAGLGRVTLNQQVRTATGVTIRAIDVKVTTAGLGLPVGTRIELGVANAWVVRAG